MKRELTTAILGVAALTASSYGQGTVIFSNYTSAPSMDSDIGQITYATDAPTTAALGSLAGTPVVDPGIEVQLFWALGAETSFANEAQFLSEATPGVTTFMLNASAAPWAGGGWYAGPLQVMPTWTSGPVTFAVEAWETTGPYGGSTYATSMMEGISAMWQETAATSDLAYGIHPLTEPPGNFSAGPPSMTVEVPEPSVLAFGGLGAGLLALRRRK